MSTPAEMRGRVRLVLSQPGLGPGPASARRLAESAADSAGVADAAGRVAAMTGASAQVLRLAGEIAV